MMNPHKLYVFIKIMVNISNNMKKYLNRMQETILGKEIWIFSIMILFSSGFSFKVFNPQNSLESLGALLGFFAIATVIALSVELLYFKICKFLLLVILFLVHNFVEYYISLAYNPGFRLNPVIMKMVFDTTFSEAKDVLIAQDLFTIKSPLAFSILFFLESFVVYKVIFKKEIRNNSL